MGGCEYVSIILPRLFGSELGHICINQGRRTTVWCGGALTRKRLRLEKLSNGELLFLMKWMISLSSFFVEYGGGIYLGNLKDEMLLWWFGMEEERHVEQIDRKWIRSSSLSMHCDMRFRSSLGSSDQSTSVAMKEVDAEWWCCDGDCVLVTVKEPNDWVISQQDRIEMKRILSQWMISVKREFCVFLFTNTQWLLNALL